MFQSLAQAKTVAIDLNDVLFIDDIGFSVDAQTLHVLYTSYAVNIWNIIAWYTPELLVGIAILFVLAGLRKMFRLLSTPQVSSKMYCSTCNYDLGDLVTGAAGITSCSECGSNLSKHPPQVGRKLLNRLRSVAIPLIVASGLFVGAAIISISRKSFLHDAVHLYSTALSNWATDSNQSWLIRHRETVSYASSYETLTGSLISKQRLPSRKRNSIAIIPSRNVVVSAIWEGNPALISEIEVYSLSSGKAELIQINPMLSPYLHHTSAIIGNNSIGVVIGADNGNIFLDFNAQSIAGNLKHNNHSVPNEPSYIVNDHADLTYYVAIPSYLDRTDSSTLIRLGADGVSVAEQRLLGREFGLSDNRLSILAFDNEDIVRLVSSYTPRFVGTTKNGERLSFAIDAPDYQERVWWRHCAKSSDESSVILLGRSKSEEWFVLKRDAKIYEWTNAAKLSSVGHIQKIAMSASGCSAVLVIMPEESVWHTSNRSHILEIINWD